MKWMKTNELFKTFNIFLFVFSLLYCFSIWHRIDSFLEFIIVLLTVLLYNNIFMIPAYIANTNKYDNENSLLFATMLIMVLSDYYFDFSIMVWTFMLVYALYKDDIINIKKRIYK